MGGGFGLARAMPSFSLKTSANTLAMNRRLSLLVPLLIAVAHVAPAADNKAPEGKSILTPEVLKTTCLHVGPKLSGQFKLVEMKDQPFQQAINARIKERPDNLWTVQCSTTIILPPPASGNQNCEAMRTFSVGAEASLHRPCEPQ